MGGFIYGLAVVLLIFEGIIIQCEGAGDGGAGDSMSSNRIQDAAAIATKEAQIHLSNDKIEEIVKEFDSETVLKDDPVISNILQHHIVQITSWDEPTSRETVYENYYGGDLFLRFADYERLGSFFAKFGDKVRKIEYEHRPNVANDRYKEIKEKFFKNYSNTLEEVRIFAYDNLDFWEGILRKENIRFPNVKKLEFECKEQPINFQLITVFPNLEIFEQSRHIYNVHCLKDIITLRELALDASKIKEDQLKPIFVNNPNIVKIRLYDPKRVNTMRSIATHLKNLETLELEYPDKDFLLQEDNTLNRLRKKPELQSVKHFHIKFNGIKTFGSGNHSFVMPSLKTLTFDGNQVDDGITNFINNFNNLDKVELFVRTCNTLKYIAKLKHVTECTTNFYGKESISVKEMMEISENNPKLQVLKFVNVNDPRCQNYENIMKMTNDLLGKRTWSISHEYEIGRREKSLVFRRVP